jgi:hypothetical protein
MATGAPTTTETEKTEKPAETTPASPPAAKTEPAKPAAVAKTEPAKPNGAVTTTETVERKRVSLKGDDDELPDDADLFELTPRALKSRLTRHTKKELKDRFGTDDPDEITAKLKRLESLEAEKKAKEDEELSEKEKLKKERDDAVAAKTAAETRAQEVHEQRLVDRQDTRMSKIAEKSGVDPDYFDVEFPKLARWLKKNHKKDELAALPDKEIAAYWKDRLEKKPKLAKDYDAKSAKEAKPKAPLDNSVRNDERPNANPSGSAGSKRNYAPGKPDSMSRAEAKAEAAKEGYNW